MHKQCCYQAHLWVTYNQIYTINIYNIHIPVLGHSKHCSGEANDTPSSSKQHWSNDKELLPSDSPPQCVVLKQTGANEHKILNIATEHYLNIKLVGMYACNLMSLFNYSRKLAVRCVWWCKMKHYFFMPIPTIKH